MPTFNRIDSLANNFSKIRTSTGIVDKANSFIFSQISDSLVDAFNSRFQEIYNLESQLNISSASGVFLSNYGKLLNEPRDKVSYAADMTLSNVYVSFSDDSIAMNNTINGGDFILPAGTFLSDEDETIFYKTLDDIIIRSDESSAFARVIADKPDNSDIDEDYLSVVHYDLALDGTILSGRDITLVCNNSLPINGSYSIANDDEYRYILDQKRNSIGVFNTKSVVTLMDVTEIVNIVTDIKRGIINIYLDTSNKILDSFLIEVAKEHLNDIGVEGLNINVLPSVYKKLKVTVSMDSLSDISNEFKLLFIEKINNNKMGSSIDFEVIQEEIKNSISDLVSSEIKEVYIDSRELIDTKYQNSFNSKLYIENVDITII